MTERHNCGGTLEASKVTLMREARNLRFVFSTQGLRCNRCGEEVISRNTARSIEHGMVSFELQRLQGTSWITIESPSIYAYPEATTEGLTNPLTDDTLRLALAIA